MKSWILALLLATVAIVPVFVILYKYKNNVSKRNDVSFNLVDENSKIVVGSKFEIKACKVISGDQYEMYLEGGKWIRAKLLVSTKDKAKQFVIDLLNKTVPPPPSVTIIRKSGDQWIVDINLNVDGQRVNLVDLLKSNGLLL